MAINDLVSKIITEDQFSKTFDKYNQRLDQAEGKSGGLGVSLTSVGIAIGAVTTATVAAAEAIKRLTDAAIEYDTALANVQFSAQAANAEFGDTVGSAGEWVGSISELSDELRVFSDTDVANATSRLIDMTKRLGLTDDQMRELLRRTGDLSAGKVDLAGGIERVTAAMRGEAESAEYLGLSLNENSVRSYAEAQGLVWTKLTDLEKAQQRYALFLEQTNTMQGRAASYADTLQGKEAELNREIERQVALMGEELLPLRADWVALKQEILENALVPLMDGLIQFEAVWGATLTTAGGVLEAFAAQTLQNFQALQAGMGALFAGEGFSGASEAMSQVIQQQNQEVTEAISILDDIPGYWEKIRVGILESKRELVDLGDGFSAVGEAMDSGFVNNVAGAVQSMISRVTDTIQGMKDEQLSIVADYNGRMANIEFDHAQRMARLAEDLAQTQVEAAEDAARARMEAEQDYAYQTGRINESLQQSLRDLRNDYEDDLSRLGQDRSDAERDLARERESIERDLQSRLADLTYKTEQDRLDIHRDYADDLVRLEKSYADKRQRINDEFSDEYADADPFKRKMLEYNRQERLRQLEEEEAAERTALENERDQALSILEERTAREQSILEENAAYKQELAEREYQDELEQIERRRDALEDAYREDRAREERSARASREALDRRHSEEMARIAEQEARKIAAAQEAIENERRNYQDRLADLEFWAQQELGSLETHLDDMRGTYQTYYANREGDYQDHIEQMNQIGAMAQSIMSGSGKGLPSGTTVTNNVNVDARGATSSLTTGHKISRSVIDALRGF